MAYEAVGDPALLEVRPSLQAAALLLTCRTVAGIVPAWPGALAALTGYTHAAHTELSNASKVVSGLLGAVYMNALSTAEIPDRAIS